jgi:hypothetical protein
MENVFLIQSVSMSPALFDFTGRNTGASAGDSKNSFITNDKKLHKNPEKLTLSPYLIKP